MTLSLFVFESRSAGRLTIARHAERPDVRFARVGVLKCRVRIEKRTFLAAAGMRAAKRSLILCGVRFGRLPDFQSSG
jgi:hypothetical protein